MAKYKIVYMHYNGRDYERNNQSKSQVLDFLRKVKKGEIKAFDNTIEIFDQTNYKTYRYSNFC